MPEPVSQLARDIEPPTDAGTPATGSGVIRRALWRHRGRLARGYPLILLWQLCESLVPVVIGVVIDQAVAARDGGALVRTLLLLVAVMTTLSYSYRFGSRFVVRGLFEEEHLLRTEIAAHVLHPRGARTASLPGETLSLATSDASKVSHVLRQLGFAVAALLSVTVVAVYVLQVDLILGLIILLGVPTILAVISVVTPLVARRTGRQQESIAVASGLASDLVQGLRPLKGIGGENVAMGRYRLASARARHDTIAVARSWGYLAGLAVALSGLFLAVVTLVAGARALDGEITLGQLVALVGLTQFFAEPIGGLGEFSAQFGGSLASARRIAAFLASPRLLTEGDTHLAQTPGVSAQLVLRDVHSGPLRGLTLETRPGELLAVVIDDPGAAAALVGLLAGEQVPERGEVLLGRMPLGRLSIASRHRALLVSPHHAQVFEGTLRSAIDPDGALDATVLDAVLLASGAGEVVALHPEGLDREVREGGSSLSGGQRQRLALARALASRAPLLVLHDPTSAVDAVTEQAVSGGLQRFRRAQGHTTLVVTSSPSLLHVADRVVVLRDGRVVAEGGHAELLHRGAYPSAVTR